MINKIRNLIVSNNLDGYIIPKNDEFFGEYIPDHNDRLSYISNFTGSYGFSLILKNKNCLFVDGRYTLQAKKQSGKYFKVITFPQVMPRDILKKKKLLIGFDPKLFTKKTLSIFFAKTNCVFKPLNKKTYNNLMNSQQVANSLHSDNLLKCFNNYFNLYLYNWLESINISLELSNVS